MNVSEMVEEFATVIGQEGTPELYATLIQEEFDEWRSEYIRETKEPQLKELADLVYVLYGYAKVKGWDLGTAVCRIHLNNLGRCIQPDGTTLRRADGKVVKNPDYPKPDLGDLV